ncbi:unnamed protein product [Symbiodinium microadriaticum]|nr:unnamed protein product [Symbiodinium sp. KB8]CAE7553847.1 unnamed protein product [Symbiodinium microadriaticum]
MAAGSPRLTHVLTSKPGEPHQADDLPQNGSPCSRGASKSPHKHVSSMFQSMMDQLAEQHMKELAAIVSVMEPKQKEFETSMQSMPFERRNSRDSHRESNRESRRDSNSSKNDDDKKRPALARSGTVAAQVMVKHHQDIPELHADEILEALEKNASEEVVPPDSLRNMIQFRQSPTVLDRDPVLETDSEYVRRMSRMTRLEKVQRTLQSPQYEMFMALVLCLNVIWMAIELQLEGTVTGQELNFWQGSTSALSESRPVWDSVLLIGEICFTSFFALDVVCRICILGSLFWKVCLNYIDVAVSITSIVELSVTVSSQLPVSPVLFRLLRLGKLARAIRVVSMSSVLASLQLLVKCLASSRDMLFWSFCLLTFVQCVAGMILSTLCADFINDAGNNLEIRKEVFLHYGTFTRTILSMFEILFANWSPPCRVLVENISEWFSVFFLLYRCVLGFAVINVVNSVFVQQTMKTASSDEELAFKQKQRDMDMYTKKVRKLFQTMDASGDGAINLQEFAKLVKSPKLRFWMSQLELEYHDLLSLFEFLDNGDGQITLTEFIEGAARLKGSAKALDVWRMECKIELLFEEVLNHLRGKNPVLSPVISELGDLGLGSAGMPGVADVQDVFAQSGYQHMPLGEKQHGDEFVRVRMADDTRQLRKENGDLLRSQPEKLWKWLAERTGLAMVQRSSGLPEDFPEDGPFSVRMSGIDKTATDEDIEKYFEERDVKVKSVEQFDVPRHTARIDFHDKVC